MQRHKKLSARILSMAMAAAMVTSVLSTAVFAVEDTSVAGTVGTVQSFDKLPDRFIPSVDENAPGNSYTLAVGLHTPAEDLQLPAALDAMVERAAVQDSGTTAAKESVWVTWQSDKEYKADENGKFIYTAELPEGYALARGVALPQSYVAVGMQVRANGDAITIDVNNGTTKSGATLQAAVEANSGTATDVTSLKITAGAVTADDWNYLRRLTALETFEIEDTIGTGNVENIPTGGSSAPVFPSSIKSVTVPQAIEIGTAAFYGCNKLTTVAMTNVTKIGYVAFHGCTELTSVSFPNVASIGQEAFVGCTKLTSATFPKATSIGESAFMQCALTSALFTEVTSIEKNALANCKALTNASFPKLTTVSESAFNGCEALTTVSFPAATIINDSAFSGCTALTTASFPAVTRIGANAFYACVALTTASFPAATSIGANAFMACGKLATLKLGATPPPTVGTGAFNYCAEPRALGYLTPGGADLTGGALTTAQGLYKAANDGTTTDGLWYGWTIEAPKVTFKAKINGTDTILSGDSLTAALTGKDLTKVTELKITAGAVTTADWNALTNLTALTTFEIDAAVTTVADIPNSGTTVAIFPGSIVSVTVPQGIAIGTRAFSKCTALTSASFPAATTIGGYAFYLCEMLPSASFPKVTTIGTNAFSGCRRLTTLKLGATPPSVGNNAFYSCSGALGYVDANGDNLTGGNLATAIANYKQAAGGTDKWYSWTIETVVGPAITVTINGVAYEGDTFQNAISKVTGGATNVTSLKITAGEVTTDDWKYLKNLSALTTFEIDRAVTTVADLPVGQGTFPASIVSIKVPQAITVGISAFANLPALTTVSLPAVTSIGFRAFDNCTELTTITLPAVQSIGKLAFYECAKLTTLKLGLTPPTTVADDAFEECPETRTLAYVDANGNNLTGDALAMAIANYTVKASADGKWYGWTIESAIITHTITASAGTGGSISPSGTVTVNNGESKTFTISANSNYSISSVSVDGVSQGVINSYTFSNATGNHTISASFSYNGGGGSSGGSGDGGGEKKDPILSKDSSGGLGGTKNTNASKNNVINTAVDSKGATNVVISAIQNAAQSGATAKATFNNFAALDVAGLKAINDVAVKESAGKTVDFKVNFDTVAQGAVASRVSVDPAALAKIMTEQLPLGVYFHQQKDAQVTNVNKMLDKFFTNRVVTVSYDQTSPLAVNAEFAAKLDLSSINVKSLYIYSYNRETNAYTRVDKPNYWVDSNGYSHITAPLGGSILITDSPMTKK